MKARTHNKGFVSVRAGRCNDGLLRKYLTEPLWGLQTDNQFDL